jgi:hypothetical protein
LKKSVPKGDKKKRKTVNDEISRLEKEMNEKHLREKEQLTKASCDVKGKEDIVNGKELEKMSSSIVQAEPKAEKMTKAQKRRVCLTLSSLTVASIGPAPYIWSGGWHTYHASTLCSIL